MSDEKETIKCPKCGTENVIDNAFCENCGTKLEQSSTQEYKPSIVNNKSNNKFSANSIFDLPLGFIFSYVLWIVVTIATIRIIARPEYGMSFITNGINKILENGVYSTITGFIAVVSFISLTILITILIWLIFKMNRIENLIRNSNLNKKDKE